eukprot:5953721-Amphidinium_carterae.2
MKPFLIHLLFLFTQFAEGQLDPPKDKHILKNALESFMRKKPFSAIIFEETGNENTPFTSNGSNPKSKHPSQMLKFKICAHEEDGTKK